jgi:hypothetical protein
MIRPEVARTKVVRGENSATDLEEGRNRARV